MTIDWTRVMPVIISIGIIISVAILRQYSKTIASIAATMPINLPLAMWVIYGGTDEKDRQTTLISFTGDLVINLLPTFIFIVVAYQMVKVGYSLVPALVVGYIAWGIGLGLIFFIRSQFGTPA
jgi:F0F1-type ATP synthase assembly protein I